MEKKGESLGKGLKERRSETSTPQGGYLSRKPD